MIKKFIIIFFILIYLISCSSSNRKESTYSEKIIENPEEIYFEAKRLFDLEEFSLADEEFSKLQKLYPLSNEAI